MPRERNPSAAPRPAWIVPGGVAAGPGLRLSFQRYQCPRDGLLRARPRSLGALPVGLDAKGMICVPLAEDEAFWLGLGVARSGLRLHVAILAEFEGQDPLDVLTGRPADAIPPRRVPVPGLEAVDGARRTDGALAAFARCSPAASLLSLVVEVGEAGTPAEIRPSGRFRIHILDYDGFAQRTGQAPPAPLDPQAGYGGWRLP